MSSAAGHPGRRPLSNLETAALYQISAIAGEKLVEHPVKLHRIVPLLCSVAHVVIRLTARVSSLVRMDFRRAV